MPSKNNYSSTNYYPNQPKRDLNPYGGFSDFNHRGPLQQSSLVKFSNDLKGKKYNLSQEIQQILSEIENLDGQIASLLEQHQQIVDECIDRKGRFNLMKKEMEIKKNYLSSLVKKKKVQVEEERNTLVRDIRDTLEIIESLSERNDTFTEKLISEGLEVQMMPEKIEWGNIAGLIKSS
jgi:predicted transcriptional regulator